jgi:signal transduction histidine kinase
LEKLRNNIIRVLLVEDDEDDYVLTESLLSEINLGKYTLDWVTTYDTALEKIAENQHDVCLLDYHLGAHTGLELLREAKSKNYDIPIILLTGQGDQQTDVEAMRAGASDYLIKGELNISLLERSIRYSLEQKRNEQERLQLILAQEARAQAEDANRQKDDFLAMVSHEIRTPLNAMLGWIQILQLHKNDAETVNKAIEAIERSAKLQSKFIEDLLDITRIGNNSLQLEKQAIGLGALIEASITAIRPAAEAKNINLEIVRDGSDILVHADSERLQQVVNNLLTNAVKFTPKSGQVSITLAKKETDAEIIVKDSGIGITPEFMPYVFDRYRQAESRVTRKGGLGLGLAISHRIVDLHGGSINAESDGENQGATFIVRLPLVSSVN